MAWIYQWGLDAGCTTTRKRRTDARRRPFRVLHAPVVGGGGRGPPRPTYSYFFFFKK